MTEPDWKTVALNNFKRYKERCQSHKAQGDMDLRLINMGRIDALAELLEDFGVDVKKQS